MTLLGRRCFSIGEAGVSYSQVSNEYGKVHLRRQAPVMTRSCRRRYVAWSTGCLDLVCTTTISRLRFYFGVVLECWKVTFLTLERDWVWDSGQVTNQRSHSQCFLFLVSTPTGPQRHRVALFRFKLNHFIGMPHRCRSWDLHSPFSLRQVTTNPLTPSSIHVTCERCDTPRWKGTGYRSMAGHLRAVVGTGTLSAGIEALTWNFV